MSAGGSDGLSRARLLVAAEIVEDCGVFRLEDGRMTAEKMNGGRVGVGVFDSP